MAQSGSEAALRARGAASRIDVQLVIDDEDDAVALPVRAELFSIGQLEHHARTLAGWHVLAKTKRKQPDALLPRLAVNARGFERAYALITEAVGRGRRITPAAEWFIDNYPLIEEQIRTARRHLPRGYSQQLPRLVNASGGATNTPRVYDLILELISHSHGHVDADALRAFIAAYQSVQPLTLGELWAIPIMVRLALLEDLRRVVAHVTAGRRHRELARSWMKQMLAVPDDRRDEVVLVLADLVKEAPPFTNAFVCELATRLQAQGTSLAIASTWLDQRLAERGQTVAQIFQLATQNQAADQVSIGNCIGGLRFLSAMDWQTFVEGCSVVEHTLRTDPAGAYPLMDFESRDRYRHAVEALARRCDLSEGEIAVRAVALAAAAMQAGRPIEQHHVGFHLIDDGAAALADDVKVRVSVFDRIGNFAESHSLLRYLTAIAVLAVGLTAVVVIAWPGLVGLHPLALLGIVAVILTTMTQLAMAWVQWMLMSQALPRVLPRLDFRSGIPAEHATLVAVPSMLTSTAEIDELVDELELRWLANRDRRLHFALLTDFKDADSEFVVGDDVLVAHARAGIERLNAVHGSELHRDNVDMIDDVAEDSDTAADVRERAQLQPFALFHRARCFNATEGVWMGRERKRGKLEALNLTLRGADDQFAVVVGDLQVLRRARYVIALDADTQLPRDAGRQLVATMAHPLNTAVYDVDVGRVVRGYGILQPRVGVSMASVTRTLFSQVFAGEPGIDPYTRAVSDVYQDLFGEGSFVGKGIYDIDVVHRALAGRLPDNRVLSHDLLEGAYARCGLVSDVILVEDQPAAHRVDVSRRARWTRGDWQIASWLLPRVPTTTGTTKNPLSALSRWKIFDNLRRSLVSPALLFLLALGWASPAEGRGAVVATIVVLAVLLLPGLFGTFTALTRRPGDIPLRRHLPDVARELLRQQLRDALALAWLPIDAMLSLRSLGQGLIRVAVTRRKLLEWRTAADAARAARHGLLGSYRALWVAPGFAALAVIVLAFLSPGSLPVAAPIVLLWCLAPALAWWLSEPLSSTQLPLVAADVAFLRMLARRTWRFFAVFGDAGDNDLIPDNVQEDPPQGIAHRTSPTNIGLGLTANLAAFDFGYVAAGEVVARVSRTFATLDRLQRHRGHFYNWYDTQTLEPLLPLYVSTVDSGNLAGSMIVLASGLDELADAPLIRPVVYDGLEDTLALYVDASARLGITVHVAAVARAIAVRPTGLRAALDTLDLVTRLAQALPVGAVATSEGSTTDERATWAQALSTQAADAARELRELAPWTAMPPSLVDFDGPCSVSDLVNAVDHELDTAIATAMVAGPAETLTALQRLKEARGTAAVRAAARLATLSSLSAQARAFAEFEVDFLYDRPRRLLSIGKNIADGRLDNSFYDLLASEARLASYIAIAQGRVSQDHWFSLGRSLTTSGNTPALLSWSGSMFEYLMPLLIMPTYPRTLLDETYRGVVARQIAYGVENGVPWGVSESGYAKTDGHQNYQYRAFGVPGLGYKRGLADDLVIAPYASAMALMVDPVAACSNLRRLQADGRLGPFGFYEAVDYTKGRLPPGKTSVTVRSVMAHHQGMAFLSLAYLLRDQPMQRRFLAEPAMRATELLLQERVPKTLPIYPHPAEVSSRPQSNEGDAGFRVFSTPATPRPEVHLLSNGSYHVAVTNAGGGYSRWRDLAVTRWREDPTRDGHGTFIYLRDVRSGAVWSAAHQPTLTRARHYEAVFSAGRAELRRVDGELETHVEISVSPEDDVELRRLSLTNRGPVARTIEITSYAEVVLAPAAADAAHPAFSNLFVQTELLRDQQAILATRRPRSGSETPPTMLHLMSSHAPLAATTSFETAREVFVGRGRSLSDPAAMRRRTLSDSAGDVLDPVVAIRCTVLVPAHETVKLHIVTGVAETRDGAVGLVDKYRDRHVAERVLELSWTHSQVLLRRLDATDVDVQLYERLASNILYSNPVMRAPESVLIKNQRGQSGLWGYGISGDLPIVLVRIGEIGEIALVAQILKAHAYWRLKGLVVDVVIWNEDSSGYRQELHEQIIGLVVAVDSGLIDKPGGVFVRRADQMSEEDKILMQTTARLIVTDTAGTLAEQMDRQSSSPLPPELFPARDRRIDPVPLAPATATATAEGVVDIDLAEHNGLGGFTRDGHEYVITTSSKRRTPAPWSNVIANPWFGTVVSESGGAYTWCENAHSNRLTPWNNDPVSDVSGEAVYLRDDEDGHFWSPTPLPAGDGAPYKTRHGFGYSVFEHASPDGIVSSLSTYVATDAPVKFVVIKVKNTSGRGRRLSLTAVYELVLGAQRAANIPHVVTAVDSRSGALLATNPYNSEFAQRVAFLDSSESTRGVSGDRSEVLGRNREASRPAFISRTRLSGRVGGGLDPCMAMQVAVELADGQEREIVFTFGSGRDKADALILIDRFRGTGAARAALQQVYEYWNRTLGAVNVQTPDASLNFLANGWLLYQVLSARMWARSGFYQSGGAFGFRDQLQDSMSLVHAEPAVMREQILRCASRQFHEGDVQHWWHPPLGRGVRTRISDDYLWLPLATCRYVDALGDTGVLDEVVPFLDGRAVRAHEDSYYDLPNTAGTGSVYEHCVRAIRHGLRFGVHGLPLMGTGDWNDGMNLVGDDGRGESVWLGFFLADVLRRFEPVARRRGDDAFADLCQTQAAALQNNLETHAWDGGWYKRAWFDDGAPLGSSTSPECQIDALPQSWSVLSGVGDPARSKLAMAAVDARLIDRELAIIRLFDPPFNGNGPEPGYIRGYVPGVRENGGQYTHAAVWTTMAFAAAGEVEKAWELFGLINPVRHGNSIEGIARYKVEPYVVAADVYTNEQQAGRGGWTWYTGSAGWMYRLIVESLLGVQLEVDRLRLTPKLPAGWPEITIHYRHHETVHHIVVRNGGGVPTVMRVVSDGVEQEDRLVPLHSDKNEHHIEVDVGEG